MYERQLVKQLISRMRENRRFIQIITGPRQSGKTTAVTQALDSIKSPYHYISADDPIASSPEWLGNEWEQARLMQKKTGKDTILAVDEIQKVKQWSSIVKKLWDEDSRKKIPIKLILTGSSSLLIQKGLTESLQGRFEILYSPHWSYSECRNAFGYTLEDFLFFGGYPGAAVLRNDENRWARYIGASIVEPTIANDILFMEEVRKPALLRSLFNLGAAYSAQELSYTKIMGQLIDAGNTVTLAHYLDLLEKANMLCGLHKYSPQKIQERKSSPRLMVFDTSLMTYSEGSSRKRLLSDPIKKGHLVESAVGAYLLARSKEEGFEVYWWRERDDEVDFVLQKNQKLTAIEVKSGRVKKTGGSIEFKKKYPQALLFTIGSANFGLEDFLSGKTGLFK
ncbi:ATP-binding protein [Leadbettera azotonutricia]|uniref:ATPase n=1 Tax=Leadbettera azotonutricia (strain ATCC BAA-888 / DSM 13862 / ZAS-9) TaxID=545695 RepID=F5Y828_LEAAZ|nr:ATP-binding protein [Leadbettera azotonutricia]AEF82849.1 ATPase [Leadbettera azotonutricia ZAS-9]